MLKKIGELALGTAGGPFGWIATAWKNKGLILAIAGWALIGPAWLHGCSYGKEQQRLEQVDAENKSLELAAEAKEEAAAQQLEDELEIATSEMEAKNAISKAIDSGISDADLRLGCERMRRNGRDLSKIPQCERLDSGGERASPAGNPVE